MKKITLKKKHKKLIAAIAGLLVVVLAACYTVFIAPNLEKEEWVYKEIQVENFSTGEGNDTAGQQEFSSCFFGGNVV